MRERLPYKITPEQGWSQMQPILDKAMPVEHRSRRFILLWWLTGIAIIAILLSIILFKQNFSPVNTPSVIPAPPIEMANNDKKDQFNESLNTNTQQQEKSKDPNTSSQNSSSGYSLTFGEKTNSSNLKSETSTVNTDKGSSTDQQIGNNANVVAIGVSVPSEEIISDNTVTSDFFVRNNTTTEFLPLANVISIEEDVVETGSIGNISHSSHKRHPFHPNASIAALAGSQNGLGTNFQMGTDYAISSKFSLSGSIGHNCYHPEALNLGLGKADELTAGAYDVLEDGVGIGPYIPEEVLNLAADYNSISPLIHSLQQWQARIGIKYSLSGRFFINGGYILGFGTTAKSEYPIVPSSSSAGVYSGAKSSFNSYDVIRSTTSSIYAGIGYRITRHFEIYSDWTHGLDHYLLNEQNGNSMSLSDFERTDYIRGLSLGLRYQL